jgi:DNA-directed RNA polymerase subunit RPC12/RpoP
VKDSRATSWLNMGAAAVRAGDKADARFYLERALNSDPDLEDETQIWYWLSRITDDPAEKRRLLQDVVISEPGHAEARRELAILEGRLSPEAIRDPRELARPVAAQEDGARRYICPQCGGRLAYDAAKAALACDYCGHQTTSFLAPGGDDSVDEHDFLATLPTDRGHTWELPVARRLACQGCGASFTLPPAHSTASCPFCASAHVAEAERGPDLIAPEAVIPFCLDAEAVTRDILAWLAERRGGPADLARRAILLAPKPVYLPFWTFNVVGQVSWRGTLTAEYGDEPKPVSGSQPVWLDNCLVPASHSLPQKVLAALTDFDLGALAPYSPDLLADWPVEVYQIPLGDASLVAHQRAYHQAMEAVRQGFMPGRAIHGFSCDSSGVVVDSFKLVLLPVWVAAFRYGGKEYSVVVNGQTGAVHGQRPASGLKKLLGEMLSTT